MLQIRHLEKTIDGRCALSIHSLDAAPGEIVAVIGPSGCGKTLLLQILAGELPASGGSVMLGGEHVPPYPRSMRENIGVLFADDLLYERQSASSNLALYCRIRGLSPDHATRALALVGLGDHAQQIVARLNASMRRRLAFARALLGSPRLLLLDRPVLRADLDTQQLTARLIAQTAEAGSLVIVADEDLSWAGACCTRVIEMENGRITTDHAFTPQVENNGGESGAPDRFTPFKVPARKEDRILFYDPGDILYATSRDGKTYLRTASEEVVTSFTLQELEARLSGRGFFKAHRAYLVNLQHIKAVIQYTRNSYTLQLDDAECASIPLSRQSERELQELLGY